MYDKQELESVENKTNRVELPSFHNRGIHHHNSPSPVLFDTNSLIARSLCARSDKIDGSDTLVKESIMSYIRNTKDKDLVKKIIQEFSHCKPHLGIEK